MAKQQNARDFLQRLIDDDAFRDHVETDPVAALAEYGFEIEPTIAPQKASLPTKEHIKENIDLLAKQLEATSGWIVFCR